MLLYQKIEFLLLHLEFVDSHFDELSPISRRMYATGLVNELYQLVSDLAEINEQIETSLDYEDAYLDISPYSGKSFAFNKLLDESLYREDSSNDADINKLIDVFPLDKEDYSFTSENAGRFKTGLRYLCSEANISPRDIVYALSDCIKNTFSLLFSIDRKKKYIKDFQYEDFWYAFLFRDDDLYPESAINDYDKWKEEHDYQNFQVLKDKRDQEILKMLASGVFSYDVKPVNRDIANSLINISEDALEQGMEVPEDIKTECARFSKYVYFKEDILCLDYTRLGKYIYKHYRSLHDEQGDSLIYFDYMLLHIHEDMAQCKPKLKKHLRFYEDDLLESVLNDALKVIENCNSLLKEEVAKDFLTRYLREAFYGVYKIEVQNKLKGQSKYTLLCQMLGMLKSTGKVFTLGTTSVDLAKALATIVEKPKEESLKRYIDEGSSDYRSPLSRWTTQYVMEQLGSMQERLFVEVAYKQKQ